MYEYEIQREIALQQLTPTQQRRFAMYEDGMNIAEIARIENASFNSVKESISSAQKKLRKIF